MSKDTPSALKAYRLKNYTLDGMAVHLGVDRTTVLRWERELPPGRILEVEKITGIPRQKLRPDMYSENAA